MPNTTMHGSNADCPRVRSGEWDHCKGHEEMHATLVFRPELAVINNAYNEGKSHHPIDGFRVTNLCFNEPDGIAILIAVRPGRAGISTAEAFDAVKHLALSLNESMAFGFKSE